MNESRRSWWVLLWRQLPFFIWLIIVWVLLWGQLTVLSVLTGVLIAIFVTRIFALPPVEMSGRINVWYLFLFVANFALAVVWGSIQVTWQVMNPKHYPGTAIVAIPLRTDDDLIMTHVGVTASLIPGSLVLQTDRDNRVLYLHVIGVRTQEQLEKQRQDVLRWEDRIVRALGSSAQYRALKAREAEVPGGAQ